MKTVLVIFFLTVQSSYSNNSEVPATKEAFDTVQFFASGDQAWRIKTFATDQDVHVWKLGKRPEDVVALARTNTEKTYGDVLKEGYIIETDNGLEGVREELEKRGLEKHLEVSPSGFVFWSPAESHYKTKSSPKQ